MPRVDDNYDDTRPFLEPELKLEKEETAPEPESAGRTFDGGSFRVFANVSPGTHNAEGVWFTLYQDTGSQLFTNPKELLKAVRASPGTATGDAIRNWFTFFVPNGT